MAACDCGNLPVEMLEFIIAASALLVLSVFASKLSDRFGVPALLLFLALGMLAGSDGPGGIYFDDPALAQFIGVVSLALILFSGGLDTRYRQIRPILKQGLALATLGVFFTALVMAVIVYALLDFSPLEAFLFGAIVSSTDAAAVFTVLRARGVHLRGRLKPLLELESGANDPLAVFLTITAVQWLVRPDQFSVGAAIGGLLWQMLLGAALGLLLGWGMLQLLNRFQPANQGLYPVLTLALVLLAYGLVSWVGGNGFLAVYLAGIYLGNHDFIHKRSLLQFHDGVGWLVQIIMFLTLGLLVFPSRLPQIAGVGLLAAGGLIFVARPLGVFLSLAMARLGWREKLFISWVGLRGAAPIVLATFPLLARLPNADQIFNMVFFVVLASVLLQGNTLAVVARLLGLAANPPRQRNFPIEYVPMEGVKSRMRELSIPTASPVTGQKIVDLHLPDDFLVILVAREQDFIIPSGGLEIHAGDVWLVLSEPESFTRVCHQLGTVLEE